LFVNWLRAVRLFVLASPIVDRMASFLSKPPSSAEGAAPLDIVFVTPPPGAPGWILEAVCRELASRLSDKRLALRRFGDRLPPAHRYFFSHYVYLAGSMAVASPIRRGRSYVFATHLEPDKHRIGARLLARVLNHAEAVICMNTELMNQLKAIGVEPSRLVVVHGAADPAIFTPHERRADGLVGFSSAFYARKSPERILDIVRLMPHRRFVLLGRGWREFSRFGELKALSNFEYLELDYADYPHQYRRMTTFVSPSTLEGGPIPLIEAMMSNVVPVVSRTGFAPDLIRHGVNGFLFDVDAPVRSICELVDQAFALHGDVSRSVHQCNWDTFSDNVLRLTGYSKHT
jgi:glycosyltransferase involved in cell wall biosynthesis